MKWQGRSLKAAFFKGAGGDADYRNREENSLEFSWVIREDNSWYLVLINGREAVGYRPIITFI